MRAYGDECYRVDTDVDTDDVDAYRRYCDWEIANGLQIRSEAFAARVQG